MHSIRAHRKLPPTPWITLLFILTLSVTVGVSRAEDKSKANGSNSLCLDPSLIQEAAKSDGITDPANPDKFTKSLTSNNNFISFCAGHKLTNGAQVPEGSCNPTPMGMLPSTQNMPSVRILSPTPKTKIAAHQEFDVIIGVRKMETGRFTSPSNTYYLVPQVLNSKGQVQGHLHVVIQLVHGKRPLDPLEFVFFKGVADAAIQGKVNTTVTGGLPDGTYRISTLTSAMNHQLVALPIAKRGIVDDVLYVEVGTGISSPEKAGGGDKAAGAAGSQANGFKLQSVDGDGGSNGSSKQGSSEKDPSKTKHIKGEGTGQGSDVENKSIKKKHKSSKSGKVCKAKKRKNRSSSRRRRH